MAYVFNQYIELEDKDMTQVGKPYVVIFFPEVRKAYCLNRSYDLMFEGDDKREVWGKVKIGDIVQTEPDYHLTNEPGWANSLRTGGHPSVGIWTNYFD